MYWVFYLSLPSLQDEKCTCPICVFCINMTPILFLLYSSALCDISLLLVFDQTVRWWLRHMREIDMVSSALWSFWLLLLPCLLLCSGVRTAPIQYWGLCKCAKRRETRDEEKMQKNLTVHFYSYQYIKWEEIKLRKTPSSLLIFSHLMYW